MEYFMIVFIINNSKFHLIWFTTSERDGFLTEGNEILFWNNISELKIYEKSNSIIIDIENQLELNIDYLQNWCKTNDCNVDYTNILNFWNTFADFSNSISVDFLGNSKKYTDIYEKLFYGNNLPSLNKSNKIYTPKFDDEELKNIKKIMMSGISIVLSQLIK